MDTTPSATSPTKALPGAGADLRLDSNADDEAAEIERHATATLIGTVGNTNAILSLPIAQTGVEQDQSGNWIAPLVPLYPQANGNVKIQLKRTKDSSRIHLCRGFL